MVTDITDNDFEATVTAEGITLVDFWAEWCGPCRSFAPVFEAAADDNPDIRFVKLDTEHNPAVATELGVRSIPTIMAFRDGVMVYNAAGALPRAALDDLIAQVRDLDMEEVHAALAAQ